MHMNSCALGNTGLDCNFERGWCSYTTNSSKRFSFRKHQGHTASIGTGPHYDHTYGNGSGTYVYAEASSPARANDTTQLTSGEMPAFGSPGKCISFWYHMYGPHVGTLRVLTKVNNILGYYVFQSFFLTSSDFQPGFRQYSTGVPPEVTL